MRSGTHTQAVPDQVAHGDLAFALEVGRARFQAHRVRLLQLQFGRVLAGDDALVVVDELRQAVEQRGLAGAGAAGDQRVDAAAADDLEDLGALRRDRAEVDELVERQLVLLELTDGERGAVDRERRHDHVDAGAVGQARVADRRGFVDAAADLADDALADVQKLLVVAEADAGLLDLAFDFDVGGAGAVHHDVGDVVARQQRLERAVAEHVVADVVEQLFLLGDRHHDVLDRDDLVDDVADFLARANRRRAWRAATGRWPRSARRRSSSWSRNSGRCAENRRRWPITGASCGMVLRLPGVGAPTTCAPRPADGIGERPPSTAPARVGRRARAGLRRRGRRRLQRRLQRGRRLRRRRTRCGRGSGAWLSAALRFPNTLPYSRYQLRLSMILSENRFPLFGAATLAAEAVERSLSGILSNSGENRLDFDFLDSERPVSSCAS